MKLEIRSPIKFGKGEAKATPKPKYDKESADAMQQARLLNNEVRSTYVDEDSGLIYGFVNMENPAIENKKGFLRELNVNLATDLANVRFVCDNKELERKLNVRPNEMDNGPKFWSNFWFNAITNGVGVISLEEFVTLNGVKPSGVQKERKTGYVKVSSEEITDVFHISELVLVEIPLPRKDSATQVTLVNQLASFLRDTLRPRYKYVSHQDVELSKKDLDRQASAMDKAKNTGTLVIDNKTKSFGAIKNEPTFDEPALKLAIKTALNSRKVPFEYYNQEMDIEKYNMFFFSYLMLKLQQLECELREQMDDSIRIYHNSLLNLSPETLKVWGMLGGITYNELRKMFGYGPVPGGDELIKNWNDSKTLDTLRGGEKIDKKTNEKAFATDSE